jgi:hypothetical protein
MRRLIAGSVPGHRVADGTAKRPESLCLILVVPSSGRRVPPPPGTLLPGPSSYGLIRQSAWLSSPSAFRLVQGVCAGCYQALLPRGSSRRYLCESFSGCLSLYPGGPPECSCLVLPQSHRPSPGMDRVGFPLLSANTIFHGTIFGAAAISLCSGLCVCSPPRSFLPLQKTNPLQGSRGFYVRAERASLPSHASDMLSARLQAIGGTRTYTSQDSQPCRLLTIPLRPSPSRQSTTVYSGRGSRHCYAIKCF